MNSQTLFPTKVSAMRIGNEAKITITATGHEEGMTNIRIVKSPMMIYPPIYMVQADPSPAIGYFPYSVSTTVSYPTDLDYVQFVTANGTERIPIYDVMQEHKATPEALLKSTKTTKATSNQVVGYAYNSTDINKAIADAVTKLQAKFPGNVSAKMIESGFVAAGAPVGIAYYYVIMQQNS